MAGSFENGNEPQGSCRERNIVYSCDTVSFSKNSQSIELIVLIGSVNVTKYHNWNTECATCWTTSTPGSRKTFSTPRASTLALCPTQFLICAGVKRSGREADHSLLTSVELKREWS